MVTLVAFIHIFVALFLILFVLLQDSKGGAMGIMGGGGGSNSLFGATGASSFLVKATRWVAIVFAVTCITLTYFSSHTKRSVLDTVAPTPAAPTIPVDAGAPVAPAQTPPAPTEQAPKTPATGQ